MRAVSRCAAIVAAVCGVSLGGASVDGIELTRNGGFEEPDLSAWRLRGLDPERIAAPDAPEGAHALRISPDPGKGDPQAVAQQALPYVTPGAPYVFGAALAVSGAAAQSRVAIEWMDGDDGFGNSVLTSVTDWTTRTDGVFQFLSAQATAPARARSALLRIEVRGVTPGVVVRVDAVTVDGPAPATSTPTAPADTPSTTPSATTTSTTTPTPTMTPTTGPGEELRNPGFEEVSDGVPVAWQKYGGDLLASARARSGEGAGLLRSASDATKWIYQTVLVEGGAWYAFGAWVLADDPAVERALLRISWYASADGSGSAVTTVDSTEAFEQPASGYRYLTTGPVQAPPEARSARARVLLAPVGAGPAFLLIDDASWGRVPPPTATPTVTADLPTITAPSPAGAAQASPARDASAGRLRSEVRGSTAPAADAPTPAPGVVRRRPAATPRALEPRAVAAPPPTAGPPWWAWTAGAAAVVAAGGLATSTFLWWRRIS